MNIVKSAPFLVLLAALFAGCNQTPDVSDVEAVCAAESDCAVFDLLHLHGLHESAETCSANTNLELQRMHEDPLCAGIALRLEDVIACGTELSCPDLSQVEPTLVTAPEDLPKGLPCREQKVALFDELVASQCRLPLDTLKQKCQGPNCPEGILKMACDNRAVDGTCFDFTTTDRNDGVGEPFCQGTRMETRCPLPGTMGFCFLEGPAVGQRKLRYYTRHQNQYRGTLEEDCEERGGTYAPW